MSGTALFGNYNGDRDVAQLGICDLAPGQKKYETFDQKKKSGWPTKRFNQKSDKTINHQKEIEKIAAKFGQITYDNVYLSGDVIDKGESCPTHSYRDTSFGNRNPNYKLKYDRNELKRQKQVWCLSGQNNLGNGLLLTSNFSHRLVEKYDPRYMEELCEKGLCDGTSGSVFTLDVNGAVKVLFQFLLIV